MKVQGDMTSKGLVAMSVTSQDAAPAFEAPHTEHAQWHPVNKSLLEASMARGPPCEAVR